MILVASLAGCASGTRSTAEGHLGDAPSREYVDRVEALAILETLNAALLSHDSATATLADWCERHRLAARARIVADRIPGEAMPASPLQRRELAVSTDEPVRFRHVRLRCGDVVLSEADNWYVPARLTQEMNAKLESTDEPFGKVVAALHFQRHTLSANLLWQPLPANWDMSPSATRMTAPDTNPVPPKVLEHRAILSLPDGTPFSEVVETYTAGVLAFRAQRP
jgi:chorismate-pyruvate lyase